MSHALRSRNQSQQIFTRNISSAWSNPTQLFDPSIWLLRDPDAEEKMLLDADIRHAIDFRRQLVAGSGWNLMPSDEASNRSELAVDVGTKLLDKIHKFAGARFSLARAFFSGERYSRIHGTPMKLTIGDGKERTWWVPVRLEDQDKRMYRIVPDRDEEDQSLRAHYERWNIGKREWMTQSLSDALSTIRHSHEDDQSSLGYGSALREALGWSWYAKTHVLEKSLSAIDRYANGVVHVEVDGARDAASGLPNDEVIKGWLTAIDDFRSDNAIVSDSKDKISIIESGGTGYQLLSEMRGELKSTIFTLVMGANLTTSANEGGSYALAEVQENSTQALIKFDREALQETLTDDLMGCIWAKNGPNMMELGIDREKPLFSIVQEKIQEPQERAATAAILHGMGIDLARDDIFEKTGFRMPEPGEEVIDGAVAPQPGGDLFPGFGFGPQTPAASVGPTDPSKPPQTEIQETAMNGAQVTAAADIIDRVVRSTMPAGTAVRMLIQMFNIDPTEAQAMVSEAEAFTPPAAPAPTQAMSES